MAWVPPWETSERESFRVRFDDDADAYDRTRPVAPPEVFDELVALAGLVPGSTVVEIGPGTGQATRPLADRGLRVTALEIGPELAARARQNLAAYAGVEVLTTSFEAWDPGAARFDAVFACNSFHWVDPALRFEKAAALLGPGGSLVVLATPWVVPDDGDRFWWDVQDDWVAVGSERLDMATMHPDWIASHPDTIHDISPGLRASGRFEEPVITRSRFDVTFTAGDYTRNLSTQSGFKELPPDAQPELLRRVHARIVDRGGTVTGHLLAVLTVAQRRD